AADNDFDYINPYKPFDPNDPDRQLAEPRQNAGNEQYYGLLRWYGDSLTATLHAVDDRQELPTLQNSATSNAELQTEAYSLAISTSLDSPWNGRLSQRFMRETYRDRDSQLGLGPQHTIADTAPRQISLGRPWRDERLHSVFSAGYTEESAADSYRVLRGAAAAR